MAAHLTRRPKKALTAQAVKNATKPGKYFDGHGLYLRVDANGSRFWVQRITIRGKRCELGLGSPELVSLAEARTAALENRKLARSNGDPLQARRAAQAALTFEEAARKVHALHLPTWKNAKHAAQFITTLETYAFPKLGKLKVQDVTTADVLAVLTPIWTEKPETARRVRQRIGTVMKWAIAQGWRQDNPAENIGRALPKVSKAPVHRRALPYAEPRSSPAYVAAAFNYHYFITQDDFTAGYLLRDLEILVQDVEAKALKAIEMEKRAGEAGGKSSRGARARRIAAFLEAIEVVAKENPGLRRLGMTDTLKAMALEECRTADPDLWKQGAGQIDEYIGEIRRGEAGKDLQERYLTLFPQEPPKR